MKKFDLDNQPRGKQLCILLIIFTFLLGALCITGCATNSCEGVKCDSRNDEGYNVKGISIPGCGGCNKKGCNSCLWARSCKLVAGSTDDSVEEEDQFGATGCDIRYYGGGCLGCGTREKSCYYGCMKQESAKGFFYGSTDGEEKLIGCMDNGCGGCIGSDGMGGQLIGILEESMRLN